MNGGKYLGLKKYIGNEKLPRIGVQNRNIKRVFNIIVLLASD